MASITIMIGGAALNAAAFIGGNYLVRAISGGDKAVQEGKVGTTKPSRLTKLLTPKCMRDGTNFLTGSPPTHKSKNKRRWTSPTPTTRSNSTTKPTQISQCYLPKNQSSRIKIQPSKQQKQGELLFVGAGVLALGCAAFRFLCTF